MLKKNPRMAMQLKNLTRLDPSARDAISQQAATHRRGQLPNTLVAASASDAA
jgi:deoxyribodipyrimidine photolyase-related protein